MGPLRAVGFTADDREFISCGFDELVRYWDVETGQETHSKVRHRAETYIGSVSAAKVGAARARVFATGDRISTIHLWDLETGDFLATLTDPSRSISAHSDLILGLSFSSDGRWLVSSGKDEIVLWDMRYYERHIAGNVRHQLDRLEREQGELDPEGVIAWEEWADDVLDR